VGKEAVLAVLIEMHEEWMRLHKMRKMYEESNEGDCAEIYANRAIGLESAMAILRNSAGISFEEYLEAAARAS